MFSFVDTTPAESMCGIDCKGPLLCRHTIVDEEDKMVTHRIKLHGRLGYVMDGSSPLGEPRYMRKREGHFGTENHRPLIISEILRSGRQNKENPFFHRCGACQSSPDALCPDLKARYYDAPSACQRRADSGQVLNGSDISCMRR